MFEGEILEPQEVDEVTGNRVSLEGEKLECDRCVNLGIFRCLPLSGDVVEPADPLVKIPLARFRESFKDVIEVVICKLTAAALGKQRCSTRAGLHSRRSSRNLLHGFR